MKSMILGVTSEGDTNEQQRSDLLKAGVSDFAVMPLTDEQMESVFTKLKAGMKNGSYKKPYFKALIVNDDADNAFRSHHENLIRKAGGLVSMSVFTLTDVQLGISYDIILVTKVGTYRIHIYLKHIL